MSFEFHADQISVSDLTDKYEELESEIDDFIEEHDLSEEYGNAIDLAADVRDNSEIINKAGMNTQAMTVACEEFYTLHKVLEELEGNGGDHQWQGNWYPAGLIAEDHFTDYIMEMIRDTYPDLQSTSGEWPYRHMTMDYEAAANEAQSDYTVIEIEDTTYYYR